MNIAYFDIISGISGDMTLGACVDAGVPFEALRDELRKLPLEGYTLARRTISRSHISAVKIDVDIDGGGEEHHHRGYNDIVDIIDGSTLSEPVRERAKAMFLTLARAEAHVHGTTVEEVHFHEVGAVDSIVDIVGAAICLDMLGVDRVCSSAVRTGAGATVQTQHGRMPVPAPATMEILRSYPVALTDIPHELTTPTGATIIATLSEGLLDGDVPFTVSAVGYGAGSKDIPGTPNLLRLLVGSIPGTQRSERLLQLDTNIDDMNPELLPHVIERLLGAGARDAWLTPVLMKKGRPAHMLSVLTDEEHREALLGVMYAETSTTGIRVQPVARRILPRAQETADTRFGQVTVKVIYHGEHRVRVPEYEECRRIARERNLPLIQVYRQMTADLTSA